MPTQTWSVQDVRDAERAAMADLPEGELMGRAARGLALVLRARAAELTEAADGAGARLVVLAGSGGNGGDAVYAAARVADAPEIAGVVVVRTGSDLHEGALAAALEAGVGVLDCSEVEVGDTDGSGADDDDADAAGDAAPEVPEALRAALEALAEADVVVDGMIGIGGRPGLSGVGAVLADAIGPDAYVVAVDLPSGTDPGGERVVPDAVFADETVTFGVAKPVHVLAGAPATGLLTVVDIGVTPAGPPAAERLDLDDVAGLWPVPGPADDKYSRGVLGVVAGGEEYTGAPVLSVTAAVCSGAGMVRYVGPPTPTRLVRERVPEAVHGVGRVQAWLVGPGLDPHPADDDEAGQAQVRAAREALASGEPAVVDAGGLELLDGPRAGAGARTLLTPHAGELARLLDRLEGREPGATPREQVEAEPVAHARRAARLTHATVLLKGATTYVVPPTDALPVRAQADAPPWLATAGAGDVLAGLAGTLLAAGLDPLDAGSLAALVHGRAADAAVPGGPVRALAVAEAIGPVVATLLRRTRRDPSTERGGVLGGR
ncbi:bifunctional ADP-dependent NAD(P)H-hydrate dehydratase/NAD(P)H-hydrate epimerase [Agilicoccus flavus]|uniref:bifunctional ADP-dependent NAD(P)H-hydrate dehydratase/NAD(P)H-hydrate epimerase n=1 Tax=Agilicoccus flavus TaxID=2775968 RepID=UPI001CF6F746|nr:bifunctional ADP-dependent NAD(P)H-hydrate dehydratase/NAD(P)H-hydrate epimerase [Agilicoccus flavus]